MLNKILLNFSEDELLSFLSPSSVSFSRSLIGDVSLDKELLSKMVLTTKKSDFIFDIELRSLLIERMPSSIFIELFHEFGLIETDLRPKHYDAAISWANENLLEFSKKLGMADLYEMQRSTAEDFVGISLIEPGYALYPYQRDISKKVLESLSNGEDRVLIHLPTGSGKTRTAMNIVSEHLRGTLYAGF
jgi:DNA repair protein RadD